MIKQVIVVRKNLGMRKGKIAAQVAHASMGVVLKSSGIKHPTSMTLITEMTPQMKEWLTGSFTKVVVYVNTNEEFYELMETLDNQTEIEYCKITDNGATEFHGVKTDTCVAIGPAEAYLIDAITGGYKLL